MIVERHEEEKIRIYCGLLKPKKPKIVPFGMFVRLTQQNWTGLRKKIT